MENKAKKSINAIFSEPAKILTVLEDAKGDPDEYTFGYLKDELKTPRYEIDDSFDSYARKEHPWGGYPAMEIRPIPKGAGADGAEHCDVSIRFITEDDRYKYSSKEYKSFSEEGKFRLDAFDAQMQTDVAKHTESLLFPFLFAVERLFSAPTAGYAESIYAETVYLALMERGVAIDDISIEEDAIEHPELIRWFRDVGESILEAYKDDPMGAIRAIAEQRVFVVCGEFDPAKRNAY